MNAVTKDELHRIYAFSTIKSVEKSHVSFDENTTPCMSKNATDNKET